MLAEQSANDLRSYAFLWRMRRMPHIFSRYGLSSFVAAVFALAAASAAAADVWIDIDPWSSTNQVNPVATGNIVVIVQGASTLNGDPENFDVTQVDQSSVVFGPDNAQKILSASLADFNGDATPDIAFAFAIPDTGITCGDSDATLSGSTTGGLQFSGVDAVETLECDGLCHPAPPVELAVVSSAGAGGQINPAAVLVHAGTAALFTVIPDNGFVLNSVTGCGGSLNENNYTTAAVTAACEITASFATGLHLVTASAGGGGTISPSSISLHSGAIASFTLTPNDGYDAGPVTGCGGSLTDDTYDTGAVYASCEVNATFIPDPVVPSYVVGTSVGPGGEVIPASAIVTSGNTASFTLAPAPGYRSNTIRGCNGSLNGGTFTTGPVTAPTCVIQASFTEIPAIEAYLSDFSVKQTDELELFVSTSLESYDVIVSRIGPSAEMVRYTGISGGLQQVAANAYEAGPDWVPALQIGVPAAWPSGVYELRIEGRNGSQEDVREWLNFVVRANNPSASSKILVVDDGMTVIAYNNWGGRSSYGYNSAEGFPGVAFALSRPGNFRVSEEVVEFANWAAAMGYNLEWAANLDLHKIPALLEPYETIVILGHNEYWSRDMRNAFDAHTANGGNALILSGDTMWFQVRVEADRMVSYKNPITDPLFNINNPLVTTHFFEPPVSDPENRSIGVSWRHGGYVNFYGHYLASEGWGGYLVADPDHELLAATGLVAGEMFGQAQTIVGYEADGVIFGWIDGRAVPTGAGGTPANFEIVAWAPAWSPYTNVAWLPENERHWEGAATFGSMQLPSGGRIINMATVDWADGLFTGGLWFSDRDMIANDQVSRITFNALRLLGHLPDKPDIKGQPVYTAGEDLGIFVWKEFFDGPYHIVTNGRGSNEHFLLTVIASSEIASASSWGLSGSDSLMTGTNWLEFDSSVSDSAEGVDFSLSGSGMQGAVVALGVKRSWGNGPFDIKLGQNRQPVYPSGWTLQNVTIPQLPSFTAGTDLGIFIGRDTPEAALQIRWSSNGRSMPGAVQVLASTGTLSASGIGLETDDSLHVDTNSVDTFGEVQRDGDGIDIAVTDAESKLAILASLDGLFESRLVNRGELGMADTILLPPVTPRGRPEYDPGQEAALHVWLDDYGTWHVQGSAGGESRQYSGSIESSQPIDNLDVLGLQPSDSVTLVTPTRVEFSININGNGEAGFSLQAAPGTTLSLDLSQGPEPLRIGAESWPVASVPVDIGG